MEGVLQIVVSPCVYTFATAALGREFPLQPSSCPCTPSGSRFRCFTWYGGDFFKGEEISVQLLGTSSVPVYQLQCVFLSILPQKIGDIYFNGVVIK